MAYAMGRVAGTPMASAKGRRKMAAAYQGVSVETKAESASPHRMVLMLLEGAVSRIMAARTCMARKQIACKGEKIGQAISIVDGLRASLDKEKGGELAAHLEIVYVFAEQELLRSNIENDPAGLTVVEQQLKEILDAWKAMPTPIQRANMQQIHASLEPTDTTV